MSQEISAPENASAPVEMPATEVAPVQQAPRGRGNGRQGGRRNDRRAPRQEAEASEYMDKVVL